MSRGAVLAACGKCEVTRQRRTTKASPAGVERTRLDLRVDRAQAEGQVSRTSYFVLQTFTASAFCRLTIVALGGPMKCLAAFVFACLVVGQAPSGPAGRGSQEPGPTITVRGHTYTQLS